MNIFDYIDYYKEYNFNEIKFNEVDALLFSILAYLPFNDLNDGIYLHDLVVTDEYEIHSTMEEKALDVINKITNSKRYYNIKIYNYKRIQDDNIQFGAVTFRCKEFTFISFEGTNSSMIGWIENFRLSVEYLSKTQEEAIAYLNNTLNRHDKIVYVGGHSKGGNLAMVSVMYAKNSYQKRIKKVYNFDGPGVPEEILNTNEFIAMNEKCLNFLPEDSLIGILLNNINYTFVSSKDSKFNQHYLTNWKIFGTFIEKGKQSDFSIKNKNHIDSFVKELKYDEVIELLKRFKIFLKENDINYTSDLTNNKFESIKKILFGYKDINEDTKKMFIEIIKMFIKTR